MPDQRGAPAWMAFILGLLPPRWRAPVARLFRFGVVGASGFVVNEGLLFVGHGVLGLPLSVANVIAIEAAIISNYLLNDRWTFRHAHPSLERFLRFNGVSLVSLVVNLVAVQIITKYTGIHYLAANAIGVLLAFAVNYLLNVYWAYGRALSPADRAEARPEIDGAKTTMV